MLNEIKRDRLLKIEIVGEVESLPLVLWFIHVSRKFGLFNKE
jgi:hypothetical protein